MIIHPCPDKIEGWGMCNEACSPKGQQFAFTNMNLLTDEECKVLSKWVIFTDMNLLTDQKYKALSNWVAICVYQHESPD